MFSERSPSRSASISRTGPLSTARVDAAAAGRPAHIAFPIASSSAIDTIVAGSASRHSARPTDGPSSHGPTSRVSSPASPLIAEPDEHDRQQHRREADRSPSSTVGSLSSSIAAIRQYVRLPSCSRTPRPGGGGGTGGRCEASSRFAWRRSPSASRHVSRAVPASSGSPIHSGASRTPSASPPPITSRYVSPWPSPTTRYSSVRRAARRCGERSIAAVTDGAAARVTSPLVEGLDLERRVLAGHQRRACGPRRCRSARRSCTARRGRRRGRPPCVSAAPAGRPSTPTWSRRRRCRRRRAARSRRSRWRDRARSRGDLHRGAHAREVHGAAGGLDHDRHVVGHGQPVAHVAGADHLLRAARDDAHGAVLHAGAHPWTGVRRRTPRCGSSRSRWRRRRSPRRRRPTSRRRPVTSPRMRYGVVRCSCGADRPDHEDRGHDHEHQRGGGDQPPPGHGSGPRGAT